MYKRLIYLMFTLLIVSCGQMEILDDDVLEEETKQLTDGDNLDNGDSSQDEETPLVEVIKKSGTISEDETWNGDKIYLITGKLQIEANLTILPGCIVKIKSGVEVYIRNGGKVDANGTEEKMIIFTSEYDPVGGKTSTSTREPKQSDWSDINIDSTGSTFNYCRFSYGEDAIDISTSFTDPYMITISNSLFTNNYCGLNASALISDMSQFDTNRFYSNYLPVILRINNKLDITNSFTSEDGSLKNDKQYIHIYTMGNISVDQDVTLYEDEVPYYFQLGAEIINNSKLILSDYVTLLMNAGQAIRVEAGSDINLGDTAIITSVYDDSRTGNSVKTVADYQYWDGIQDGLKSSSPYRTNLDRVFYSTYSSR